MRITVVGAGGVGGFFGGRLAAAGHDVSFVARGAQLEAMRRNGLAVASVAGDFAVSPVRVTDEPVELGEADAILLAVKTWQLETAAETVKPLVGKETAVVTLQNGVDAPGQAAWRPSGRATSGQRCGPSFFSWRRWVGWVRSPTRPSGRCASVRA